MAKMGDKTSVHVVAADEHLHSIAYRYGVPVDAIWMHEGNRRLRETGRSPSMLSPLDVVTVPVPKRKYLPVVVGATNRFVAKSPMVDVVFVLRGQDGRPLASEPYSIPSHGRTGSSDGDGKVHIEKMPVETSRVLVHLTKRNLLLRLTVGALDPVTTERGRAQRLQHLGLLPSSDVRISRAHLSFALERFRLARGVEPGSENSVDDELREVHGL